MGAVGDRHGKARSQRRRNGVAPHRTYQRTHCRGIPTPRAGQPNGGTRPRSGTGTQRAHRKLLERTWWSITDQIERMRFFPKWGHCSNKRWAFRWVGRSSLGKKRVTTFEIRGSIGTRTSRTGPLGRLRGYFVYQPRRFDINVRMQSTPLHMTESIM